MLTDDSAFWGQSFVAELTRISAHGEKKLKLRRASLARAPTQTAISEKSKTNGHSNVELDEDHGSTAPQSVGQGQLNGDRNETAVP